MGLQLIYISKRRPSCTGYGMLATRHQNHQLNQYWLIIFEGFTRLVKAAKWAFGASSFHAFI